MFSKLNPTRDDGVLSRLRARLGRAIVRLSCIEHDQARGSKAKNFCHDAQRALKREGFSLIPIRIKKEEGREGRLLCSKDRGLAVLVGGHLTSQLMALSEIDPEICRDEIVILLSAICVILDECVRGDDAEQSEISERVEKTEARLNQALRGLGKSLRSVRVAAEYIKRDYFISAVN